MAEAGGLRVLGADIERTHHIIDPIRGHLHRHIVYIIRVREMFKFEVIYGLHHNDLLLERIKLSPG